jgi:hypothetical protein
MRDLLEQLEVEASARDVRLPLAERKARGVVHTPAPIARFVARAVDAALTSIGLEDGLSDRELTVLDPATGPGIFLAAVIERSRATGDGARCIGLDVDARAIEGARAHLAPHFDTAGWPLELRCEDALASVPSFGGPVAIIGNPPWTARTASRGATDALLEDFRRDADGPIRDRKIGVLSDAYVRFVRWALAVIERSPHGGVIGLVTNGSFLDGAVHRGMRTWMARVLDRIDVVDLGGSALVARRGARDENVFGVRPSVAITIMTRAPGTQARAARARRASVVGSRAAKLEALATLTLDDPRFEEIPLAPPAMRFTRAASVRMPASWPSIEEWMPFHREGIQTNRDELAVGRTREEVLDQIAAFLASRSNELARGHFDPRAARAALRAAGGLDRFVAPIAYRPLDDRYVFTHRALCHRARTPIAEAMAHEPLALVTSRRDRGDRPFAHLGVVFAPADNCYLSARSSCRARVFPVRDRAGQPNLDARIAAELAKRVGPVVGNAAFHYLIAVLSSGTFRARYDEALRHDPPRVPLPADRVTFERIAAAGARVVEGFRATGDGSGSRPLVVGHWEVLAPTALTEAIAAADEAVGHALALPPLVRAI